MKTNVRSKMGAIIGAACIMTAISVAGAGQDRESVTVGWFLQQVATARQVPSASENDAWQALRGSGVPLPDMDPRRVLTEGDVVAIGRALGVSVSSATPAAPFDKARAQTFVATFAPADGGASTRDAGGTPNDASDNGKGKKKGHNKSVSEPL